MVVVEGIDAVTASAAVAELLVPFVLVPAKTALY
jgi:hypothetical protein